MYQRMNLSHEYPTLRDVLNMGIQIFDDSWTTYIPEHKKTLCDKIIKRYMFNEIGSETPDRFVFYLNEQLARIMPYYNQLYASELIKFDPMLNQVINSSSRDIENIIKAVKADNSRAGTVMRDFINNQVGLTDATAQTGVKSVENLDKITKTVYNKDGTDDSTTDTHTVEHSVEDKDTWLTKDEKRTINETTNSTANGTETQHNTQVTDNDQTMTDIKDIDIVVDGVTKDTTTGTVVDDGVGTSKSTGKKDWTETKDDDATTKVVTDLDETTSSSSRKDYADTPQINLGSSGGGTASGDSNNLGIRTDYLTNVTWTYDNGTHSLNSTVDTTFADDETKKHTENTSDNTDTTNKNTQTTNMVKDGTSKTTTDHTENNNGTKNTDETVTTDISKNTTDTLNKTVNTTDNLTAKNHENTHTDGTVDTDTHQVYDDDWTEKGNTDVTETYTLTGTKNTAQTAKTKDTKQSRQNDTEKTGSVENREENTTSTTDIGKNNVTSGYTNISGSALLEAFRKTFLNIDEKILDDLKENFMSVF